uniref:Uncharacterized protein n=1 Tax=Spironucleus salmonicida TaxID=348837 RepID=V6LIH8_9EUKA|eukprot:EST44347.1 Hypothetical protein SS50377_15818 [Spironucleus salmonicida]
MGTMADAKKGSAAGLRSGIKGTTMFRFRNLDSANQLFSGFGRPKRQRKFTLVGRLSLNLIVSLQQCGLLIWSGAVQLEWNIMLNLFLEWKYWKMGKSGPRFTVGC